MLRDMTNIEFQQYLNKTIKYYIQDKINAGNWTQEEAPYKVKEEYNKLLPNGKNTPDNYLFSVVNENKVVGIIWFAKINKKSGFIYDINIDEKYQGNGYGTNAMKEIEVLAKNLGLEKIKLHVFGHNKKAINLYKKLEYKPTNILMSKQL